MVETRVYRVTRPKTLAQAGRWLEPGDMLELEVAQALTVFRGSGLVDAETGEAIDAQPIDTDVATALNEKDARGKSTGIGLALQICRHRRHEALRARLQAGGSLPKRPAITVPIRRGEVEGLLRPSKTISDPTHA